ncbi:transcription initiation factor IIB-like [Contarinia nasturtii]|uniref:transcription initiation factor IIB-like n=1 Tax=Contarinia nasturtii TaxID=265458 RepID=UPI0012D400EB|nr:transcription initiation factor IIB-like [Contarinia nasturtii]
MNSSLVDNKTVKIDKPLPQTEHKNVKMVREQQKSGCKTHGSDNLTEDHSTGDIICTKCALVVEERMLCVEAEWRNFADDSQAEKWAKSRTGDTENPLLSADYNLGTMIKSMDSNPKNMTSFSGSVVQHYKRRSIDNALTHAFKEIDTMGDRISLPSSVLQRAKVLYQQLYRNIKLKGNILLVDTKTAACLYVACRMENCSRSKGEISAIYAVSKSALAGAVYRIYKILGLKISESNRSTEMIDRYCGYLAYSKQELIKARKISKLIESRTPKTKAKLLPEVIAAASIFLASASIRGTLSGREHVDMRIRLSDEIGEVVGIKGSQIVRTANSVKDDIELIDHDIFH